MLGKKNKYVVLDTVPALEAIGVPNERDFG